MSTTNAPGVRLVRPSRAELESRRAELLELARMSEEELRRRAADGDLSADEYFILQDIRAIDFLLDR